MDDLELELKVGFLEEADQLLADAEQCFLEIEQKPQDQEIINQLFRLAHNLKGSAKAVGFAQLGEFTHLLESLLLKIKGGEVTVTTTVVNLLLACKDQLQFMLDGLRADLNATFDCEDLSRRLVDATESPAAGEAIPLPEIPAVTEVAMFEEMPDAAAFAEAEDEANFMDATPQPAAPQPAAPPPAAPPPAAPFPPPASVSPSAATTPPTPERAREAKGATDDSIRVSLERVDQLINFVGELVVLNSVLAQQAQHGNLDMVRGAVQQLGKLSVELQEISMSLRMVPLKTTFQKMQRIVRDTSQALGKSIQLHLEGEETEVEKTVLERIGDPLVHLVRNACDHGIDSATERAEAGKPAQGRITLRAYHLGDNIILEVDDDGRGIDPRKIETKALERGILRPEHGLSDQQLVQLIFHPGFSTKSEVSDISGRGVGLDVVKTNIEELQGSVEVSTQAGRGSRFRVQLPLTLAIVDATIVRIAGQRYAVPMSQVIESLSSDGQNMLNSVTVGEVVSLRDQNLPVHRLQNLLGLKGDCKNGIMLVCQNDAHPFALMVDEISSVQQIVVKKLGAELSHLVGITGSAILGDGKPALILDLPRLAASAAKGGARPAAKSAGKPGLGAAA